MLILTYHGFSKAIFSVTTFFPYSAIRLLKCQSIYSPESDCGKMLPFQPGGLSGFIQQQRWISTPNTGNCLGNTKLPHCIQCKYSVPTIPAPPEHVLPVREAGEGINNCRACTQYQGSTCSGHIYY